MFLTRHPNAGIFCSQLVCNIPRQSPNVVFYNCCTPNASHDDAKPPKMGLRHSRVFLPASLIDWYKVFRWGKHLPCFSIPVWKPQPLYTCWNVEKLILKSERLCQKRCKWIETSAIVALSASNVTQLLALYFNHLRIGQRHASLLVFLALLLFYRETFARSITGLVFYDVP